MRSGFNEKYFDNALNKLLAACAPHYPALHSVTLAVLVLSRAIIVRPFHVCNSCIVRGRTYAEKCEEVGATGCVMLLVKAKYLASVSLSVLLERWSVKGGLSTNLLIYSFVPRAQSEASSVRDVNRYGLSRCEVPIIRTPVSFPSICYVKSRILSCFRKNFAT